MIYAEYRKNKNKLYGCFGRNINSGKYEKKDVYGSVDIIIGRTIMFHRKHLYKFFKVLGRFSSHLEDDILLSYAFRTRHRVVDVGKIKELPRPFALSKRPDHLIRRQEMINYCLNNFRHKKNEKV